MPCPFCHSPTARDAKVCRVCGGPLRATGAANAGAPTPKTPASPVLALPLIVTVPAPVAAAPVLLARKMLDENTPRIASVGFCGGQNPTIGLALETGAIQLWDAHSDVSTFCGARIFRKPGPVCCAAFAPNLVATGHECGQVRLHALDCKNGDWKGRVLKSPAPHLGRVLALAITPTQLYSGGSDGAIAVTTVCAGERLKRGQSRVLLDGLSAMTTWALSPDGASLAVGGDNGAVQLWRLEADETPPRLDWTSRKLGAPVRSLAFSPNGAMLIGRSAEGRLCLWAVQSGYPLPLAPRAQNSAVAPVFAADSRLLALVNVRGGVDIVDVGMDALLHELPPLGETARFVAFAPDESATLLVVAGAREAGVWQIGV